MQIKHSIGKLPLPGNVDQVCKAWLLPLAAETLAIELGHIGKSYDLPYAHRDPFDRILIAQALAEGMTMITPDLTFTSYKIPVIW